jgi:hypothetical protein
MIRGIGDPLLSIYARAYICRVRKLLHHLCSHIPKVGMTIAPQVRTYLPVMFKDFLRVYPQVL